MLFIELAVLGPGPVHHLHLQPRQHCHRQVTCPLRVGGGVLSTILIVNTTRPMIIFALFRYEAVREPVSYSLKTSIPRATKKVGRGMWSFCYILGKRTEIKYVYIYFKPHNYSISDIFIWLPPVSNGKMCSSLFKRLGFGEANFEADEILQIFWNIEARNFEIRSFFMSKYFVNGNLN